MDDVYAIGGLVAAMLRQAEERPGQSLRDALGG
jgi:hypothetical protein